MLRCAAQILRPFSGASLRRAECGGSQSAHTSSLTRAGCTLVGHATQRRLTPRLALLLPAPSFIVFAAVFRFVSFEIVFHLLHQVLPDAVGETVVKTVLAAVLWRAARIFEIMKKGVKWEKKDMWDAKEMSLCHTACSALVHVSSTF